VVVVWPRQGSVQLRRRGRGGACLPVAGGDKCTKLPPMVFVHERPHPPGRSELSGPPAHNPAARACAPPRRPPQDSHQGKSRSGPQAQPLCRTALLPLLAHQPAQLLLHHHHRDQKAGKPSSTALPTSSPPLPFAPLSWAGRRHGLAGVSNSRARKEGRPSSVWQQGRQGRRRRRWKRRRRG
jgi:hypothetical protein